jgi:hypothetical protein
MISNDMIVIRSGKTAWQIVQEKVVVVTPETKKIHILYGSGSRIWQYLDKPKDLRQILKALCDEYDVNHQQAEKDIKEFIRQLNDKGIVFLKTREKEES